MDFSTSQFMRTAIDEAIASLRGGNHGFGAVIVKDGEIVARAHDTEETDNDPTAHAEMNAIRAAVGKLGKHLGGCTLLSTHEPCPMCATAIVWSGIERVGFGYGISDAIDQGRRRIDLPCETLFEKANATIAVERGIMASECAVLYNAGVRREIKRLRNATDAELREYDAQTAQARIEWFAKEKPLRDVRGEDTLLQAYHVLAKRFGVSEAEIPIVRRDAGRIVFRSRNFCPTLEACNILGLDTRHVCKIYNEQATDALVKQVDPRLRFARDYDRLRPHSDYCEELILLPSGT